MEYLAETASCAAALFSLYAIFRNKHAKNFRHIQSDVSKAQYEIESMINEINDENFQILCSMSDEIFKIKSHVEMIEKCVVFKRLLEEKAIEIQPSETRNENRRRPGRPKKNV